MNLAKCNHWLFTFSDADDDDDDESFRYCLDSSLRDVLLDAMDTLVASTTGSPSLRTERRQVVSALPPTTESKVVEEPTDQSDWSEKLRMQNESAIPAPAQASTSRLSQCHVVQTTSPGRSLQRTSVRPIHIRVAVEIGIDHFMTDWPIYCPNQMTAAEDFLDFVDALPSPNLTPPIIYASEAVPDTIPILTMQQLLDARAAEGRGDLHNELPSPEFSAFLGEFKNRVARTVLQSAATRRKGQLLK